MKHSPLHQRDLHLLCLLTDKAIDGATKKLTLSISRLQQEVRCSTRRRVITSLCRLHLANEIRVTFHKEPLDSATIELLNPRKNLTHCNKTLEQI